MVSNYALCRTNTDIRHNTDTSTSIKILRKLHNLMQSQVSYRVSVGQWNTHSIRSVGVTEIMLLTLS